MDGYAPSTVHKSDLFFSGPAPPPIPQSHPLAHHASYSAGKARSPAPNYRNRSRTAPASSAPPHYVSSIPPPLPPLESHPNQEELEAVMQLSRSESEQESLFMEKLSSQEEEDLARALEESLRTSDSFSSPGAGPSSPPHVSSSSNSGAPDRVMWSSPPPLHASLLDDEALARQLAAEEEEADVRRRESATSSGETSQPSLEDDEAFARRLALEEEADDKPDDSQPAIPPPTYNDTVSPPRLSGHQQDSSLSVQSSLLRSNSSNSSTSHASSSESPPLQPVRPQEKSMTSSSVSLPSVKEQLEAERNMGPINVNQFVDKELLQGVCEYLYLYLTWFSLSFCFSNRIL